MSKAGRGIALVAALTLAGVAPVPALAQEAVTLRVLEAGRAAAGIEVLVLFLGEAWRVGETDAGGRIVSPLDLVGLEPGERVEVHRIACGGAPVVVLAPPGEDAAAECARRGGRAGACRCGRIGEFRWGEDATLELSGDAAAVIREPDRRRPPRFAAPGDRSAWLLAVGAGVASFPQLDRGCRPGDPAPPVARCELEAERPTIRAALELRPLATVPWLGVRGEFGWTPDLEVRQLFASEFQPAQGGRDPDASVVEMDVFTFGGFAVGRRALRPTLDLFLAAGYVWAYNRAEVTTTFDGQTLEEERDDSGGRLGGRAGLDWWRSERWGVRLEAGGMVGEEDDADTSWHVAALLLLPLGGAR